MASLSPVFTGIVSAPPLSLYFGRARTFPFGYPFSFPLRLVNSFLVISVGCKLVFLVHHCHGPPQLGPVSNSYMFLSNFDHFHTFVPGESIYSTFFIVVISCSPVGFNFLSSFLAALVWSSTVDSKLNLTSLPLFWKWYALLFSFYTTSSD